ATGEHFAAKKLAFKRAAGDRENGERAARCRADLLGSRRVEPKEHERSRIHEFVPSSENFVDGVDRTFCAAVATGDSNETIQERVRGMRGLEPWRGPKVVGRRIDHLAACDRRDHFRRTVA